MNKIILTLISIFIALICISGACAASDVDDYASVIDQQDIVDDIGDDVIDESTDDTDMDIENDSEDSSEIIVDNSTADDEIIEDMTPNDDTSIEDRTADDSACDVPATENTIEDDSPNPYLNDFIDDMVNQIADEIVDNITRDVVIPDLDVQPINITIDILGPTYNAAIYYYAYWIAYKDYYGPLGFAKAISAIYALVHQSYGSLDTINIVNAIFDMDPSISRVDDGSSSGPHHNIIT